MAEINHYLSEEDAFQLDTVSVRLVKTREPITSEEPLTSSDAVVRALAKEMRGNSLNKSAIGFNKKMIKEAKITIITKIRIWLA